MVVALLCAVAFANNPDLDEDWADFQQRYDKNYKLEGEAEVKQQNIVKYPCKKGGKALLINHISHVKIYCSMSPRHKNGRVHFENRCSLVQFFTLLENLKLCPKIQFSEKFKIVILLNF